MTKALSELMLRHDVTLAAPDAVPLSEPSAPMILEGLASTGDVDIERVQFAPFAFDPLPSSVPLHFDHRLDQPGRIEHLAHNDRGERMISAYVDHPLAVRCGAWSVNGDVLEFTLHDTGSAAFFARVQKIKLREISLVPRPVNPGAKVPRRERPSPMSAYIATSLQRHDLLIQHAKCIEKLGELLLKEVRAVLLLKKMSSRFCGPRRCAVLIN
jgi:hypothetical protein